jgi:type IV secretion system protein VirD4
LFFTFIFIRLIEQADANKTRKLDVPVKMLLDEFANIVSIPDFEKKLATARSRAIECHVIIQSLPQLTRVYGKDSWQEIRANCSTVLVLKVEDDYTAEYVSNQLGKTTVEVNSRSREVKPVTGASIFDQRENTSATGRLLMEPNEITNMPASRCIVFMPSPDDDERVPALLQTVGYTEFPEAEELKAIETAAAKKENNLIQIQMPGKEAGGGSAKEEEKAARFGVYKEDKEEAVDEEINNILENALNKKRKKKKEKISW